MTELTSGEKIFYMWWVGVAMIAAMIAAMIVVIVVMSVSGSVPR